METLNNSTFGCDQSAPLARQLEQYRKNQRLDDLVQVNTKRGKKVSPQQKHPLKQKNVQEKPCCPVNDLDVAKFIKGDYDDINVEFDDLPGSADHSELYTIYIDESSYLTLMPDVQLNALSNLRNLNIVLNELTYKMEEVNKNEFITSIIYNLLQAAEDNDSKSIGYVTGLLLTTMHSQSLTSGGMKCPDGCNFKIACTPCTVIDQLSGAEIVINWFARDGIMNTSCRYCLTMYFLSYVFNGYYAKAPLIVVQNPSLQQNILKFMTPVMLLEAMMLHLSFNVGRSKITSDGLCISNLLDLEKGKMMSVFNRAFAVWKLTVGLYLHVDGCEIYSTPHLNRDGTPTDSRRLVLRVPNDVCQDEHLEAFFRVGILEMFSVNPLLMYSSCVKLIYIANYDESSKHGYSLNAIPYTIDIPGVGSIAYVRSTEKLKIKVIDRSNYDRVTVHVRLRTSAPLNSRNKYVIQLKNEIARYILKGVGAEKSYPLDSVDHVYAAKFAYDKNIIPDEKRLVDNINMLIEGINTEKRSSVKNVLKAASITRLLNIDDDFIEFSTTIRVAKADKNNRHMSDMFCLPTLIITREMIRDVEKNKTGLAESF